MSLPRKHNLEQLKRIRKLTKGDIGDIVSKESKKKEKDMPNSYWMNNPLDRNVDTYESFIKKDNKSKINESYNNKGKGPGNNDLYSKQFKQTLRSFNSPSILQTGKQVKVGDIRGYIDYIDDKYIYISTLDGKEEKITFKKFLKEVEKEGVINENSGFPSEFWMDNKKYNNEHINENIYIDNSKKIKCDDCGELVDDSFQSKVNHIYNKHFNKPEMDGSLPVYNYSYEISWPQGGKELFKLITKYFPKKV